MWEWIDWLTMWSWRIGFLLFVPAIIALAISLFWKPRR